MLLVYAVKDIKVSAFMRPVFAENLPTVLRSLTRAFDDANHDFTRFINDYQLYKLGEYDETQGKIIPLSAPEFVMTFLDIKSLGAL